MLTERIRETTSFALSNEEVLALLDNKSGDALLNITQKIASQYGQSHLKEADKQAAEQVFRLVMRETETRIRAALSKNVTQSRSLPRDIAITLARDVAEVALPMLEYSEALSETDLIELVQATQDHARYLAISRRETVGEKLSDTLIARGNEEVAATLVQNIGADISENGMDQIVSRYPENKPLMSALVSRPTLPATVAEKLINHVSASLAQTLRSKHRLAERDIEQEVEKTRELETLRLVRVTRDHAEIDRLVNQLIAYKRLTPSLILIGLSHGNFDFFETSLARLAGVPVSNARALISDRGELGFRALYNKSGLPDTMFPAVRLLLQSIRQLEEEGLHPGSARYNDRVVKNLLAAAEKKPVENLSYLLALMRQAA